MAGSDRPTTVLLAAEPSELTRRLRANLEAENCIVRTTETGAEALAVAATGFDLILLDLQLPDGDGLAVLQQLRAQAATASTPVFLLKGEGEPVHVVQRGFDFGASGYVSKHRLPRDLAALSIVGPLTLATSLLDGYEVGPAETTGARSDACPYSSRHEFGRCQAFLPLSANGGDDGSGSIVSCSHLRIGTGDTWRLYPRCAIGDRAARDRYVQELAAPRDGK